VAKEEIIELSGVMSEPLTKASFRVKLENRPADGQ
jgi:translation initiation factor IF-1